MVFHSKRWNGAERKGQRGLDASFTSQDPASVINALDADTGRALAAYLRGPAYGLFFDPARNHDAWLQPEPLSEQVAASVGDLLEMLEAHFPVPSQGDAAAETLEVSDEEVDAFCE